MMVFAETIWPVLARTTIATGVIGALAWLLLTRSRIRSPVAIRYVCCAVLAQGWLVWQINVPLPAVVGRHGSPRQTATDAFVKATPVSQSDHVSIDGRQASIAFPAQPTSVTEEPARRIAAHSQRSFATVIVGVWSAGMLCLVLWTVVGYLVVYRRIRRLPPADARWESEWRAVLSRMPIRRPVRMLQSARSGPLLCRLPRETVLVIPLDRWQTLSATQRETVLLHEAAHLRRADLLKSLMVRVMGLPQWFNPLVWWAVLRFDDAAEWACDDFVRAASDHQCSDYARALVKLSARQRASFVMSAAGGNGLTARIRRLLSPHLKEESRMKSGILCAMIVLLSIVCVLRPQAVADQQSTPASSAVVVDDAVANDDTKSVTEIDLQSGDAPPNAVVSPEVAAEAGLSADAVLTTGSEAVVDMKFLFQNDPAFCASREMLKVEVEQSEVEMRELVNQLRVNREQLERLNNDEDRVAREALELAADELETTIESRRRNLRRRFIRTESEMYYTSYQRISAAIADCARENGIRLVRRKESVADQRTHDGMPGEASDSPIDLTDHQAVIQLINRDIVYIEDGPLDITHAVLERLKSESEGDSE